jgi:uncharacterized protein (TIGR02391 family)
MLKKLYLKTLYEIIAPKGKFKSRGWSMEGVIGIIPEVFNIEPLTNEERQIASRAVYELERDGFIQTDIGQSESFKIFMERGLRAAEQELSQINLGWIDIDELLTRDDLKSKVRDDYIEGDYESCVFKAFRLLEESVRVKSGEGANVVGTTLMASAFKAGGRLSHPEAQVDAEQEGLHALMRGAIGWLKNPTSHRTVAHNDPQKTAHILAFANYLLDMVDECTT